MCQVSTNWVSCQEGLQLCRKDGRGPLHWACRHGQLEMLRFLMDAGVGHVDDRAADGTTMLMLACCLAFGGDGCRKGLGLHTHYHFYPLTP